MKVSVAFGADGRDFVESEDPVVVLIDGVWTAVARLYRPTRALLSLRRFNAPGEHVTTAFWSVHGWRPAAELDSLPVPKRAKVLARRALTKLPV